MWTVIIIVLTAAAVGGYFVFHKSDAKTPTPASQTANNTTTPATTATPVNNAVIITKTDSGVGQYLANPAGMTLYYYGSDTANTSNCSGGCLATWPAYVASGDTANLPTDIGVITRSDNSQKQYTYKTKPLYFFKSDTSAGQVTGNNVAGFVVATP